MTSDGETVQREFDDSVLRPSGHRVAVLVVLRGAEIGKRYLLNEPNLILGRDPERAQIVVADDSVSARHSRVDTEPRTGQCAITDLKSRNGMLVNGAKCDSSPLGDGDKIAVGATVLKFTFQDELEHKFHAQIENLMNQDALTGLPVKRVLDVELRKVFAHSPEAPLSVLMLDMDQLKRINDRHGHQMGAFCISEVGAIVGKYIGPRGMASRFGGDEFIAFLKETGLKKAMQVAERIRRRVEKQPMYREGAKVRTSISCGVAERTGDVETPEELIRRADDALYRAKREGRNRVSD